MKNIFILLNKLTGESNQSSSSSRIIKNNKTFKNHVRMLSKWKRKAKKKLKCILNPKKSSEYRTQTNKKP